MSTDSITYQIYAMEDDRWVLHEQYPPERHSEAIEAAKRLALQPGIKAARVVRETYDEDRGMYREFIVFDTLRSRSAR